MECASLFFVSKSGFFFELVTAFDYNVGSVYNERQFGGSNNLIRGQIKWTDIF